MPQTSGFRSARQILVVSFATQARAFILSDRNIFYTPGGGGGRTTAGSNAPGAFYPTVRTGSSNTHFFPVVFSFYPAVRTGSSNTGFFFFFFFFCRGHLPQSSARSKQYLPVMCVHLAFIRQNFHESWCRKLLAI